MIDLRGLTKVYETPVGPFPALRGIDLQIGAGEFIAVVGKSGSGKSTLINMFTGIDHPTDGEIVVAGTRVRELNEGQMAEWRGRTMGIVFQFFQLLPTLTLAENVMLPMDLARLYTPPRALRPGLPPAGAGGTGRRRRTSSRRPCRAGSSSGPPSLVRWRTTLRIVVADEPTGNLDTQAAEAIFELFEASAAAGKTIVMVTHDDELAERAPRTVVLADGLIVDEIIRTIASLRGCVDLEGLS